MDFRKVIRSHDWWTSKIAPFSAVGYATIFISEATLLTAVLWILYILLSLMAGATYVSLLNDLTDMDCDVKAGKKELLPTRVVARRWAMLIVSVMLGLVCMFFLYRDLLSFLLYLAPWIIFYLYSVPPVRLKERGVWGVLADAAGAHFFPGCVMVSSVSHFLHHQINISWFLAVGAWGLALGVRGILWHQLRDRETDLHSGLNTFIVTLSPGKLKKVIMIVLLLEVLSLMVMLFIIKSLIILLFLFLYLLFVLVRYKVRGTRLTIVASAEDDNYRMVMTEYYEIFFPVSLLLNFSLHQPGAWVVLILHLLLFYRYYLDTFRWVFRQVRVSAISVMSGAFK
ncbi:MAG: UbiA family prenyltransferase [Chitinophaga sp.]|uniref:UbiA family prenyltransferase n=1 Tax=Chitinophaga sp. TaxID=1869181 RepID=UPI001B29A5FA|nr:UbiA family prenyltransferase [Chitinophaga sp.]MBO9728343.1 UbiA family prenyltransferase [Chitinophaga sp.]